MSEVLGEQAQHHLGCVVKEMPNLRHPSNPQLHELTWVPGPLPPGMGVSSLHAELCLCPAPCESLWKQPVGRLPLLTPFHRWRKQRLGDNAFPSPAARDTGRRIQAQGRPIHSPWLSHQPSSRLMEYWRKRAVKGLQFQGPGGETEARENCESAEVM